MSTAREGKEREKEQGRKRGTRRGDAGEGEREGERGREMWERKGSREPGGSLCDPPSLSLSTEDTS